MSFCRFILYMGFSKQEYWSGLLSPFPLGHILSELSNMTHLSWMALHGMAHSFIELDKAVIHAISLFNFLWMWFSDGRDWLLEKLGLILMGRAMFSKSLIQFSVDWWAFFPPCWLVWGQTVDPCLHQRLLNTHRQFWLSLPLAFKVKFPGSFQSLCWVPRLGNLFWVLQLS